MRYDEHGETFACRKSDLAQAGAICENCSNPHDGTYGSGRFCGQQCRSKNNGRGGGLLQKGPAESKLMKKLKQIKKKTKDARKDSSMAGKSKARSNRVINGSDRVARQCVRKRLGENLSAANAQDKGVRAKLMDLLHTLKQHERDTVFFLEPVDPVLLDIPAYFNVISHPMDLGTVESRLLLDEGAYYGFGTDSHSTAASVAAVAADMRLIWSNSKLFNGINPGGT